MRVWAASSSDGTTAWRTWATSSDGASTYAADRDVTISGRIAEELYPIYAPKEEPEARPKFDPHHARRMWHPDALAATSRPKKRPSRQVQFNQVSRLRPVRPRYMSRK